MKTNKSLKTIICLFVFFICSILMSVFLRNSFSEYNSVLDKYLNYNFIVSIHVFYVINIIASICFLLLILFLFFKRNLLKKVKITSIVLFIILIITNSICGIQIINSQMNENEVVDTIPNSVSSYVDYNTVFETIPNDEYFHEQTVFNKITTGIPMNYSVQQSSSDNSVQTLCVEIKDNDLLSHFYKEQEEKYCQLYDIVMFDDNELNTMAIDKGFYYLSDNYSLGIVVIKGDKIFDVYFLSENITLNNEIIKQIANL